MYKIKRVIMIIGIEDVIMYYVLVGEVICWYLEYFFLVDVWRSFLYGGMIYFVLGVVVVEIMSILNFFREWKSDC